MFNRQFILSFDQLNVNLPDFNFLKLGKYYLYSHNSNESYFFQNSFLNIHIIGLIIHPDYPFLIGNDLCSKIFSECTNFDEVNRALYKCCGRYVIFTSICEKVVIRSDAVSLAQIYYDSNSNLICTDIKLYEFVSQSPVINSEAFSFHNKTMKNKGNGDSWIGEETVYQNLLKLLPNHCLEIDGFLVKRYWPFKACKNIKLDDNVIEELALHLKDTFQAFQNLKPLSIAVTAGNDSRLALAIGSTLRDDSYYFIDKLKDMDCDDVDIVIGGKLIELLGLEYHIHDIEMIENINTDFAGEFFSSCFYAKKERLQVVYNYYKNLGGYINICGVGEYGRSVFGSPVFRLTPNFLCHKYYYTNSKFAIRMASKWLSDLNSIQHYNYNPLALFYIEQKLGNWGAVCNSESDIAFEEVNPFASHFVIDVFISLDKKDSTYINNKLFNKLTSYFQPLLMTIPINPVNNHKKKLKNFIRSLSYYDYLDYIIYLIKRVSRPSVD